jgi:hypothetical protein
MELKIKMEKVKQRQRKKIMKINEKESLIYLCFCLFLNLFINEKAKNDSTS